ncbi:hypothetical protein MLD38_029998 [Melastoma candidum]|uniref:Uncharacterized protein n=1 Tax=Melastoma candidum TaxID=119954 RepID=A0ACB9MM87_9MYRT|nr:hypothetical protein MLD38_029998 [Melastoma candidum]
MEDDDIDGELAGISTSSSKRKAEEMLGAKDGDGNIHEKDANNGSKSEDETGAGTESCDDEGGRGVIKNLITSLFPPGDEGSGNGKFDRENEVEPGNSEREYDEVPSEDSGGIIRSIVSHLPHALPGML